MAYSEILSKYPNQKAGDSLATNNSDQWVVYDGPDRIRKKAQFVKDEGIGGIMIWELSEDVHDDRSLLRAINTVITPTIAVRAPLIPQAANVGLRVSVQGNVMRLAVDKPDNYTLKLFDIQGRLVQTLYQGFLAKGVSHLPIGTVTASSLYILRIENGSVCQTAKIGIE